MNVASPPAHWVLLFNKRGVARKQLHGHYKHLLHNRTDPGHTENCHDDLVTWFQ